MRGEGRIDEALALEQVVGRHEDAHDEVETEYRLAEGSPDRRVDDLGTLAAQVCAGSARRLPGQPIERALRRWLDKLGADVGLEMQSARRDDELRGPPLRTSCQQRRLPRPRPAGPSRGSRMALPPDHPGPRSFGQCLIDFRVGHELLKAAERAPASRSMRDRRACTAAFRVGPRRSWLESLDGGERPCSPRQERSVSSGALPGPGIIPRDR